MTLEIDGAKLVRLIKLVNMFEKLEKILVQIERYTLYVIVFLFPLVILPIFPDPFNTGKLVFVFALLSFALLVRFASIIISGKFSVGTSKLDLGVFVFTLSYLLSGILRTPNKIDAFFSPGIASFAVVGGILFFLINSLKSEDKKRAVHVYFYSGVVLGIICLLSTIGLFKAIPQLPAFMKDPSFNTVGGIFPLIAILVSSVILGIGFFINTKVQNLKMLFAGSVVILIASIGIAILSIVTLQKDAVKFQSFSSSWAIAIESIKTSPLLGVGPGNYLAAFDRFRPASYNSENIWNLKYISGRNFYLTVLSETGLLGLFGLLLIFWGLYTILREGNFLDKRNVQILPFLGIAIYLLIFPGNPVLMVVFMFLLAISTDSKYMEINLSNTSEQKEWSLAHRIPSLIVAIPVIFGILFLWVKSANIVIAEVKYQDALTAISKNDGKSAYDLLVKSIQLNPKRDVYHSAFAQINFALANSLAQKKNLTDKDKKDISTLIQQSINEGKNNVVLNPQKSANWELLGSIYRAIIPLAKDSDKFAVQSYTNAIILDPINPNLRINLGGIYYSLKNYDSAIDAFKMAVAVKPDLANSHYNLAVAYREKNMIDQAIAEMTTTLSLIDKGSKDYDTVKKELEALEAKKPIKQAASGETISAPPSQQAPIINPRLDLPPDAAPPSSSPSPTPIPTQ